MEQLKRDPSGIKMVNVVRHGQDVNGSLWLGSDAPSNIEGFGITRELNQTGLYVHSDDSYTVWFYYEENGTGTWEQFTNIDVTDEDYNMGVNIPWKDSSETKLVSAMYFQSAEEIKIRVMAQEGPIMIDGTPGDADLTNNVLFALSGEEIAETSSNDAPTAGGGATVTETVIIEALDYAGDDIYYVSIDGDDATGVGGNPAKPFRTITGARRQLLNDWNESEGLSEGDAYYNYPTTYKTIHVFPGTYTGNHLQWNKGFLHLEAGVVLKHSAGITQAAVLTIDENGTISFACNQKTADRLAYGNTFQIFSADGSELYYYTIDTHSYDGETAKVTIIEDCPDSLKGTSTYKTWDKGYIVYTINDGWDYYGWYNSSEFAVTGEGYIIQESSSDNNPDWQNGFSANANSKLTVKANRVEAGDGTLFTAYNGGHLVVDCLTVDSGKWGEMTSSPAYSLSSRDNGKIDFRAIEWILSSVSLGVDVRSNGEFYGNFDKVIWNSKTFTNWGLMMFCFASTPKALDIVVGKLEGFDTRSDSRLIQVNSGRDVSMSFKGDFETAGSGFFFHDCRGCDILLEGTLTTKNQYALLTNSSNMEGTKITCDMYIDIQEGAEEGIRGRGNGGELFLNKSLYNKYLCDSVATGADTSGSVSGNTLTIEGQDLSGTIVAGNLLKDTSYVRDSWTEVTDSTYDGENTVITCAGNISTSSKWGYVFTGTSSNVKYRIADKIINVPVKFQNSNTTIADTYKVVGDAGSMFQVTGSTTFKVNHSTITNCDLYITSDQHPDGTIDGLVSNAVTS